MYCYSIVYIGLEYDRPISTHNDPSLKTAESGTIECLRYRQYFV